MRSKGVVYDAGRVTGVTWRPDYTPSLARRELEIIKTGLHCNAVRIRARHIRRLAGATRNPGAPPPAVNGGMFRS